MLEQAKMSKKTKNKLLTALTQLEDEVEEEKSK